MKKLTRPLSVVLSLLMFSIPVYAQTPTDLLQSELWIETDVAGSEEAINDSQSLTNTDLTARYNILASVLTQLIDLLSEMVIFQQN